MALRAVPRETSRSAAVRGPENGLGTTGKIDRAAGARAVGPEEVSARAETTAAGGDDAEGEAVSVSPATGRDDKGPLWPDDAAEEAFLGEAKERGETILPGAAATAAEAAEKAAQPLPPLDELVQRVPAEVREAMEELFRARFVTVRRVPEKALK